MDAQDSTYPNEHFDSADEFEEFFYSLFNETYWQHRMGLPEEVLKTIFEFTAGPVGKTKETIDWDPNSPEALLKFIPPADGTSPFMKLPTELRRLIFDESLPGQDVIHHPKCLSGVSAKKSKKASGSRKKARPNKVTDLMILNKKIAEEIAEVMYEERFFVIHVHEGLANGGVEFLTTGLQPLQYLNLDLLEDIRFDLKFGRNQFSFRRLKKIVVRIHPTIENEFRHTPVNTHFIVKALCSLLDRGDSDRKDNRITRLEVEFANPKVNKNVTGRRAIQREQYWWDPDTRKPRETSIHDLSNIELVLRPFEMLPCHSVHIKLPEYLLHHEPTVSFVARLEETMKSKDVMSRFADDELEMKIEAMRKEMEDYVTYNVHGKGFHDVEGLTAGEMLDEENDGGYDSAVETSSSDGDNFLEMDWTDSLKTQWPKQTIVERRSEQRAIIQSLESLRNEEELAMARAIAASMNDLASDTSSAAQSPFGVFRSGYTMPPKDSSPTASSTVDYHQSFAGAGSTGQSPSTFTMPPREFFPSAPSTTANPYGGGGGPSQSQGSSPENPIDVDEDIEMADDENIRYVTPSEFP